MSSSTIVLRPEGEVLDLLALLDLTRGYTTVVLDLSDVTFFAGDGVSALAVALRDAAQRGHELRVEVVHGTLPHRVLQACGVPLTVAVA